MKPVLETQTDGRPVVLRIIARLNLGGPARHVIALSQSLQPRYRTVVVTGHVSAGEADMLPEALAAGIDVRVIPELGREIAPLRDARTILQLVRMMRELRPALVCTHTAKAGTVGRIAAILARVRVRVHTFHGHVFDGYFSPAKTWLFLWIERLLARATTQVIAISPRQLDDLAHHYRVAKPDRFTVVPLGLPLQRFRGVRDTDRRHDLARELGAGDARIIAIVGRLVPIKNHTLFLDAAARLLERVNDCVFVIVGDGEERAGLEALVRERGLTAHVRFLGWRQDLETIYAGADVVALTSRNEGTPVCLIEAMAAGCPVVATDVGGVADVLGNGAYGLLVPADDAAAMADALLDVLTDTEAARARAAAALPFAHELYSLNRLADDIRRLYDRLLVRESAGEPMLVPAQAASEATRIGVT